MHKDNRTELKKVSSPRVFFTQTHNIDPIELANKEANLTKPPQDNGATQLLLTHSSYPNSPQIDTPEAPGTPPTRLRIDVSAAAL